MKRFFLVCTVCVLAGLSAAAAEDAPPCDPVAKFFGETICRDAFREETAAYMDAMKVPEEQKPQLLAQMKDHNRKQMMDLLWQKALAQKFGVDAITPTEAETEKFSKLFKTTMKTSYEADKQTVAFLRDALDKNKFTEDAKNQLNDIISAAETGIKFYEQREKQLAGLPKDYTFITESAEKEIARSLIRHWKADKILFDVYGGRLFMGQNGPEPVDAYKKFLAYVDEKGHFEAVDPAYADIFADIKARDDKEALPEDSDIRKNYFSDPTWQFSLSNSDNRLHDLRKWIGTLPRQ